METFEYFDHAADVGIEARASTLPGLFVAAARGLMSWIGPAPAARPCCKERLALEAEDSEGLLVRWLQELLYLFQYKRIYWLEVSEIAIEDGRLTATILGAPWEECTSGCYQEVKAVTYHQLRVEHLPDGWRARVILDI